MRKRKKEEVKKGGGGEQKEWKPSTKNKSRTRMLHSTITGLSAGGKAIAFPS